MPATQINKPYAGSKGFLRALLAAIIFMILSAAILTAGFLAWHYPQIAAGANITPIVLTGNDLFIAIGKGEWQDSKLVVKELVEDDTAVISSKRVRSNASNYPILEYKITGRNPGTDVVLYWRTITHNHQTLFAKLHWNGNQKSAYNLQNHPEWKGQVTALGISIAGDLRNEPIGIEQLTFSPLTLKSLLLTVWSEWTTFEGWTQSSINVIRGMSPSALISPVVTAAAWCGMAMLMYWIRIVWQSIIRRDEMLPIDRDLLVNSAWNITKKTLDIRTIIAIFLIAWLALDWKWQVNLWQQLGDTKFLFAEKTHHEQHMAADDAELYAYAKRLKHNILPQQPVRLFILRNKVRDKTRLRLMYYLLPHNVNIHYHVPPIEILRNNDYILAINPIGLKFSERNKMLRWSKNRLKVEHLDNTPFANLYQLANL